MEPIQPPLDAKQPNGSHTVADSGTVLKECPYISTVRRHLLDFDFEKVCSVSLTNVNVYGCLVCGRYFQGKGRNTHAYNHALEASHHLFINLANCVVYCLPDGNEVQDPRLEDIKYNLQPTYRPEELQQLDANIEACENLDDKVYVPGCVGMNNLKHTDYINVVVQLLMRVRPFRQFCLVGQPKGPLSEKLAALARKLWNNRNFKGVVSPHEFVQTLSEVSQKKYCIGKEDEPMGFLLWLLNNLEAQLKKAHIKNVHLLALFRGRLKSSFFRPLEKSAGYEQLSSKVEQVNFLMLSLKLPQKSSEESPVMLRSLLQQYLGRAPQDSPQGRRYYLITEYPRYLILNFKRFTFNGYFKEKNPIIVKFAPQMQLEGHQYRLIGCICHEGAADSSVYKVYVRRADKWFMLQDLRVEQSRFEEVEVSQALIQLYERTH